MNKKDEALKLALGELQAGKVGIAMQILREALAEQPAQQEICGGCKGSGWVTRDPDIGTDQECFVCEGKGTVEPEHPVQQEPIKQGWDVDTLLDKPIPLKDFYGPAQQEPVAWVEGEEIYWNNAPDLNDWIRQNGQPLYTSPPAQRTWAGLTNEDINVLLGQFPHYSSEWDEFDFHVLARAIEAKLKAKNFA